MRRAGMVHGLSAVDLVRVPTGNRGIPGSVEYLLTVCQGPPPAGTNSDVGPYKQEPQCAHFGQCCGGPYSPGLQDLLWRGLRARPRQHRQCAFFHVPQPVPLAVRSYLFPVRQYCHQYSLPARYQGFHPYLPLNRQRKSAEYRDSASNALWGLGILSDGLWPPRFSTGVIHQPARRNLYYLGQARRGRSWCLPDTERSETGGNLGSAAGRRMVINLSAISRTHPPNLLQGRQDRQITCVLYEQQRPTLVRKIVVRYQSLQILSVSVLKKINPSYAFMKSGIRVQVDSHSQSIPIN